LSELIITLILILTPMYIANSTAMLFGGKTALDFGKTFFLDNRRIFGPGKTFKGAIIGIIFGITSALIIDIFLKSYTLLLTPNYVILGVLLTVGSIVGDIIASFFKRRSNISPGTPVLFLDQLDFVIGALIFGSFIYVPTFFEVLLIALVTLVSHKISNYVAFKTKLKKVPW